MANQITRRRSASGQKFSQWMTWFHPNCGHSETSAKTTAEGGSMADCTHIECHFFLIRYAKGNADDVDGAIRENCYQARHKGCAADSHA